MEKKKTTKKTSKTTKKPTKTVVKKEIANKTVSKKKGNKKKKGFTLIELLAVIIILGILMIIAIPSVTSYISDSRKSAYVDTAKEIVSGTRNVVNEGKLGMYDTNTTYYIPAKYVNTENSLKSPYGEFTDDSAYVGVIYDGKGYKYYWISSDDTGQGVPDITLADKLETDDIKSDLKIEDIRTTIENTGIGNRTTIKILKTNGTWENPIILSNTDNNVSEEGGSSGSSNNGPKTAAQQIGALSGLRNAADAKRFYGANPDNYVSFNNGQLWRIIGVYGNQLKIIKAEPLSSTQVWNTADSNEWAGSTVQTYLSNSYYPTLSTDAKNLIDENATWKIGPATSSDDASGAYSRVLSSGSTWQGKIGLITTYEYLYALSDSCLSNLGYQLNSCDNWIITAIENNGSVFRAWTMSKDLNHPHQAILVYRSGKNLDVHGVSDPCGVTPVVYLKSTVMISGGDGSSGNPYTLE